jgi:hypothetical protein
MTENERKQYYKKTSAELQKFVFFDEKRNLFIRLCPQRSKWLLRERCLNYASSGCKQNISLFDLNRIDFHRTGWCILEKWGAKRKYKWDDEHE